MLYFTKGQTDVTNVVHYVNHTYHGHGDIMSFSVVSCYVTLKLLVALLLLFVQVFASKALSHCEHDIGTLSWLNAKTLERVPTSLSD